jgi:hypothetical protein
MPKNTGEKERTIGIYVYWKADLSSPDVDPFHFS